jgi:transcriptional regulator with XRE-family HTH domain
VTSHSPEQARVIPLRPATGAPPQVPKEPLWRHLVGGVLRKERLAQRRTLKDVAEAARISMPYLSELERGRKEASSEVLAAAAQALGLGLADVLGLAGAELARFGRPGASRPRTAAPAPAVADGCDDGKVTSVSELSTRRTGVRNGPPQAQVRLAA